MTVDLKNPEQKAKYKLAIEKALDKILLEGVPEGNIVRTEEGHNFEITNPSEINFRLGTTIIQVKPVGADEPVIIAKKSTSDHVIQNINYYLAAEKDNVTLVPELVGGKQPESGRPAYTYSLKHGRDLTKIAATTNGVEFLNTNEAAALFAYALGGVPKEQLRKRWGKLKIKDNGWPKDTITDTFVDFPDSYIPPNIRENLKKNNARTEDESIILAIAEKQTIAKKNGKELGNYENTINEFVDYILQISAKRYERVVGIYENLIKQCDDLEARLKSSPAFSRQALTAFKKRKSTYIATKSESEHELKGVRYEISQFNENPLDFSTPTVSVFLDPKPENILLKCVFDADVVEKSYIKIVDQTLESINNGPSYKFLRGAPAFQYFLLNFETRENHPPGVKRQLTEACKEMRKYWITNKDLPDDRYHLWKSPRFLKTMETLAIYYRDSRLTRSTANQAQDRFNNYLRTIELRYPAEAITYLEL